MYRGVIIEESLSDRSVVDGLRVVETEIEIVTEGFQTPWLKRWTLRTVEIPDDHIDAVAKSVSEAIDEAHASSWFVDFQNDERHVIVFSKKVFVVNRSQPEEYEPVREYALSIGIPEHQLGFLPERVGTFNP